jgi:hypothetical protein
LEVKYNNELLALSVATLTLCAYQVLTPMLIPACLRQVLQRRSAVRPLIPMQIQLDWFLDLLRLSWVFLLYRRYEIYLRYQIYRPVLRYQQQSLLFTMALDSNTAYLNRRSTRMERCATVCSLQPVNLSTIGKQCRMSDGRKPWILSLVPF